MQGGSIVRKVEKMPTCFKNLRPCPFAIDEKPKNAFVFMPFKEEMKAIYTDGIKPAIVELGWECNRADERFDTPEVICTICKNIQEASLSVF
jgi:hypothetical protein